MSDESTSEFMQKWEQEKRERMEDGNNILKAAWPVLENSPLKSVVLEYYGSGDSGGFEEAHFLFKDENRAPLHHSISWGPQDTYPWDELGLGKVPVTRHTYMWANGLHVSNTTTEDEDLITSLVDVAESLLSYHHGGWENDEGGRGEVTFDIATRKVTLEHQEYYTETTSYSHTLGDDDGEELGTVGL